MKIPKKYIIFYFLIMILLSIPFYIYVEKMEEERYKKALDFYESEVNMTVKEYLNGRTFTLNDIDYKCSKDYETKGNYFYKPTNNKKSPITIYNSISNNDLSLIRWYDLELPYTIHKGSKSDSLIIIQNNQKFIFYLQNWDWEEY